MKFANDADRVTMGHIILTTKDDLVVALCTVCDMGMETGRRFGRVSGETLLAEWILQHAHKAGS